MLWLITLAIFTAAPTALLVKADKCTTPNMEAAECVSLYFCPILVKVMLDPTSREFIKQSSCGGTVTEPMVCCGTSSNFTTDTEPHKSKTIINRYNFGKLVASKLICGLQHSDDYFHSDNGTVITQFPWMALIEYRLKNDTKTLHPDGKYLCTGSIISQKYILTAAQCLAKNDAIPVSVRLGKYHIENETDCQSYRDQIECADAAQDYAVEKIIPHPQYDEYSLDSDIGLIRIKGKAKYSDYVRPICLPVYAKKKPKKGDKLVTSGWGKHKIDDKDFAETKKITFSKLLPKEECVESYAGVRDSQIKKILQDEEIICSLLDSDGDSVCEGDEGGPVMFFRKKKWYQVGIVSFSLGCNEGFPVVFTNVEHYFDWFKDTLKP